jgi:putative glutamine amidotransferase
MRLMMTNGAEPAMARSLLPQTLGAHGAARTRRPVLGVLCCNRTLDGRAAQSTANRFVSPLASLANVSVMLVPAIPGAVDIAGFASLLDGLLLTGDCSNLEPGRYGGLALPAGQETDPDRDEVALRLAARMIEAGKPVFGICRGLQELNVLFGGSLSAHVGEAGHYRSGACQSDDLFEHHHDVDIVGSGPLALRLGAGRLRVNSVHQQGIDRLGAGLDVEAVALGDGLVEAVWAEPCGAAVIGVQWHPEWDVASNPESRAFFDLIATSTQESRSRLI